MSAIDAAALAEWQGAVGRSETRVETLEVESLRRFALAVGSSADVERTLPPLAHWAFFLPAPSRDAIGEDGHPRRGGFLPAITLPRRMFAAADIVFVAPIAVGTPAELVATIASVEHKAGRSGDLLFLAVDRVLSQDGSVRVRERQRYVYRAPGEAISLPLPAEGDVPGEAWTPTAVDLFRFSAVTFNGHRIHYDLPYARDVEGYPALVVHGPFTAVMLAGLAERRGTLAGFSFRAVSPLFLGQPAHLQSEDGEVRAIRCDGATAMTAKVSYR